MAYQALYRKWRPLTFDDVVGQTHITNTLKNQISGGTIGHAYLFCGTRGTGKTSAAKILARAVNCENPVNGNPCNECEICRGIMSETILDVTEVDAASNNGVDNIRAICEDVNYVATVCKYIVYIIDEVHMLSAGAFNALLKTLEEPPEHVIFILATTEPHKVPQTILSRCQRFDFKRISNSDIIHRMRYIAHEDGLDFSEDAFRLLASLADGSMRDGLSIMERVLASSGGTVTGEDIVKILGISSFDLEYGVADAVINSDPSKMLDIISHVVSEGRDLTVFADGVIKYFRDLMVCALSEGNVRLDYSDETFNRLKKQSEHFSFERLSSCVSIINEAKNEAKWVKSPRVIYEMAFIRLTRPELNNSQDAILDRLSAVESKLKESNAAPKYEDKSILKRLSAIEHRLENAPQVKAADEPSEDKPPKKDIPARLFKPIPPGFLNNENPLVKAAKQWSGIAQSITKEKPFLAIAVNKCSITIDGEGIILVYKRSDSMSYRMGLRYIDDIADKFIKFSGRDCVVKVAWYDDIEDKMIDLWNLPDVSEESPKGFDSKTDSESIISHKDSVNDPLDVLENKLPEVVSVVDNSGKYESGSSLYEDFSQSSMDDDEDDEDDDFEEFLEDGELEQNND